MADGSAPDPFFTAAASLLAFAALFGRLQGSWTGNKELIPIGERVAATLLLLPIVFALTTHAFPAVSVPVRLLSLLPLEVFAVVLTIEDKGAAFTRRILFGVNGAYILMLVAAFFLESGR
jgi:hypothetical protein